MYRDGVGQREIEHQVYSKERPTRADLRGVGEGITGRRRGLRRQGRGG